MYFDLIPSYKIDKNDFENKELLISKIKEINDICLAETYKGNKVSYYYENAINGDVFSYNREIGFYAASSIKILPALILFEKADNNEVNLNEKILVNLEDLKQGSGSIKEIKENKEFSIIELIKLSLVESDNTAYLKLVDFLGKDSIKEYGLSIGATHTMESRPNDNFGIVNCNDMILYWKKIIEFINNSELGPLFKSFLSNPNTKLIDFETINNQSFLRKYGPLILPIMKLVT